MAKLFIDLMEKATLEKTISLKKNVLTSMFRQNSEICRKMRRELKRDKNKLGRFSDLIERRKELELYKDG